LLNILFSSVLGHIMIIPCQTAYHRLSHEHTHTHTHWVVMFYGDIPHNDFYNALTV